MNRRTLGGLCLFVVGVVGYVVGVYVSYPGRAFTPAAVMVGIALLATGRTSAGGGAS